MLRRGKFTRGFRCRINRYIDVTMRSQAVSLACQPVAIQRDTVLIARVELTGQQHQLQMVDELWEGVIYITGLRVTEGAADAGAVGQIMEPVTLLHQTGAQLGRNVALQPPGRDIEKRHVAFLIRARVRQTSTLLYRRRCSGLTPGHPPGPASLVSCG